MAGRHDVGPACRRTRSARCDRACSS
jgi:hypothetical protein